MKDKYNFGCNKRVSSRLNRKLEYHAKYLDKMAQAEISESDDGDNLPYHLPSLR